VKGKDLLPRPGLRYWGALLMRCVTFEGGSSGMELSHSLLRSGKETLRREKADPGDWGYLIGLLLEKTGSSF